MTTLFSRENAVLSRKRKRENSESLLKLLQSLETPGKGSLPKIGFEWVLKNQKLQNEIQFEGNERKGWFSNFEVVYGSF